LPKGCPADELHRDQSDLVLANGARFYNDHAPEYCTRNVAPDELLPTTGRVNARVMACRSFEPAAGRTPTAVQEQYGLPRPQLRLPRELPAPRRLGWNTLVRGLKRFGHATDFYRRKIWLGGRINSLTGIPDQSARRFLQRIAECRHDAAAADHQHARRASRECTPMAAVPSSSVTRI
jgi:hypothetical protein